MRKLILSSMFLFSSALSYAATNYTIDASHSSVGFSVPHLMISKVAGRFDKFDGQFGFDETTGKVENLTAKIDLDSVNTNDKKRDDHLRAGDFFGVRNAKNEIVKDRQWMTFKSTKVETKDKKPTQMIGDLTLNGITKPVTLAVAYRGVAKDPWGNQKLGFEATGKINRKDFGINWNKGLEAGKGVLVGEEVTILIDGEATAATKETKK